MASFEDALQHQGNRYKKLMNYGEASGVDHKPVGKCVHGVYRAEYCTVCSTKIGYVGEEPAPPTFVQPDLNSISERLMHQSDDEAAAEVTLE